MRSATSRTVPGSIPGGVTGFFSDIFPSNHTVVGSTQPLVKISTRNIPGVTAAGVWGWRPHHFHVPNVMEIWESKSPGNFWATPGPLGDCFTFYTAFIFKASDQMTFQTRHYSPLVIKNYAPGNTVCHPRRLTYSATLLWEPQIFIKDVYARHRLRMSELI